MGHRFTSILGKYLPTLAVAASVAMSSQGVQANNPGTVSSGSKLKNAYILGEGGYSISGKAKFHVGGTQAGWDSPSQDFAKRFGNSSVFGFGAGYAFNKYIRAGFSYRQRSNFIYSKLFVLPVPASNYVRSQNMKNKSLTLEGFLDTAGFGFGTECINPYLGLGAGVAWNRIRDAVTVVYPAAGGLANATFAPIVPSTQTSFTWQGTVGVGVKPFNTFTVDLGYRFVNMGTFQTGSSAPDYGGVLAPLSANNVYTHELYLGVRVPLG